jgi:2,4-dienoyl-CoA reductase-like NADH-dependent reductase (Old Yellow Enzyme family)
MSELDTLWRPARIGPIEVTNRVFVPAHGTVHDTDRYAAYMAARARGGAGLLVTGAIPVHPSSVVMDGWIEGWREESRFAYSRIADAVHRAGSKVFAQIYHVGPQTPGTVLLDAWHPVLAPSALPSPVFGRVAKELEVEDIEELVAAFGRATAIALDAGMDGVEVHGAHGYLIHSFLSPLTNRRSDIYGGSAANRCRFALDVGSEIRRLCGERGAVGLRINFDEFLGDAGIIPRRAEETLAILDAGGLFDYVSISGGNYHSLHRMTPPMSSGLDAHFESHAAAARRIAREKTVVMVTGAVRSIERAAEIVERGSADMVGMVRAHIADPDLVRKAREGRVGMIRRCVGANQGCWRRALSGQMVTCTVNPSAGRELAAELDASSGEGAAVLIVGGGPAGLKAAETLAKRGFATTLVERETELGGQLRTAARLPRRGDWRFLVEDLARSLERLGVDVRLGFEATLEFVRAAGAHTVVLATGAAWDLDGYSIARPHRNGIPGADASHVIDPVRAITQPELCGELVVILDESGEYLPLGLGELLATTGRQVTVLTPHDAIGARIGPTATADLPWVLPALTKQGGRVRTGVAVEEITPHAVITDAGPVPADTVILTMLRSSCNALQRALSGTATTVVAVGDCVAPREVDDAIYEGWRCGLNVPSPPQA